MWFCNSDSVLLLQTQRTASYSGKIPKHILRTEPIYSAPKARGLLEAFSAFLASLIVDLIYTTNRTTYR